MAAIRVPLASLLVDHNRLLDEPLELLVINTIPMGGEIGVSAEAPIFLMPTCIDTEVIATCKVWITDLAVGTQEMAYDLVGGGFQVGYSGTATPRATPGSGVNDELVLEIQRALAFTSSASVRVDVQVTTASHEFTGAYNFTIEDLTAPEIAKIIWFTPRRARVLFNEEMDASTILDITFADEGVEVIDEADIQLLTQIPQDSWIGMWAGLTGSIYPSNNKYRPVLAIDTLARKVTLGSTDDPLVPDTGIDLSPAGSVIRDRKLRVSITPYRLSARLDDEASPHLPIEPERIQCAYKPIIVALSAPLAEEIPVGTTQEFYVIIDFHDDISIGRMYRLTAKDVADANGNSTGGDPGAIHDFVSPLFGSPSRFTLADMLPEEYWDEDMLHEGLLRSITVVLQDLFNTIWNRVDHLQHYYDPDRCPKQLLPFLLHHLGNPFCFPIETERFQRRVCAGLDQMKRIVGTETGIEDIIQLLLPDVPCNIRPYLTNAEGWVLGESVLAYTTILSPGSPYYRNSYEIVAPFTLTDEQRRIVEDAARWADPVNAHLIRTLEPGEPGYDTAYWTLGFSALGISTHLKLGL